MTISLISLEKINTLTFYSYHFIRQVIQERLSEFLFHEFRAHNYVGRLIYPDTR